MRTTSIVWPSADLGCPLRGGYSMTVIPRFQQSSITNGHGNYARQSVEERRVVQANFAWTSEQLTIFENFFETDLLYGIRWFMFPMIVEGYLVDSYSHIEGDWGVKVIKPGLYSIGLPMECVVKAAFIA